MISNPAAPHHPPTGPVELVEATRSDRALLGNLGQLYRYDLTSVYGLLPNDDGTFNIARLDTFLAGRPAGGASASRTTTPVSLPSEPVSPPSCCHGLITAFAGS